MNTIAKKLVYLMILTLIACGGGGGGDIYDGNGSGGDISSALEGGSTENGTTDVNLTPVAITQENGVAIVLAVLSGVYVVEDREETISLIIGDDSAEDASKLIKAVLARVSSFESRSVENFTLDCETGSISYATNDANNNGLLDTGDTIVINFNSCMETYEEDGIVYSSNGAVTLTINSISVDGESVNATASYTNLVQSEDEAGDIYIYSINGSLTLDVQTNGDTIISTVSGDTIDFSDDEEIGILSNFNLSESFNELTGVWTESSAATMASTEIGGQVNIITVSEFQGVGDEFASTGELKIEGANGSFVSLNADTGNVDTVLLTISGGGATTSEEVNWADL